MMQHTVLNTVWNPVEPSLLNQQCVQHTVLSSVQVKCFHSLSSRESLPADQQQYKPPIATAASTESAA